jgi:hypothetical protein
MPGQDRCDPEQETQDDEVDSYPEPAADIGQEEDVEAHAEQDYGDDKPWCIGCAD